MEFPKRSGKQAHREVVKNLAYLMHCFEYIDSDIRRITADAMFQSDAWISEGHPKEKRSREQNRGAI